MDWIQRYGIILAPPYLARDIELKRVKQSHRHLQYLGVVVSTHHKGRTGSLDRLAMLNEFKDAKKEESDTFDSGVIKSFR
jgi:hypothetical protein